jgi:2-dehydro-3-deoxy-D-gluconate 5-dehydrogenase
MTQPDTGVSLQGLFALDGRIAFVTGASSGLGRAAVRALHAAGAQVVAADQPDRLDQLADLAAELGLRAETARIDVADEASVAEAFADLETRRGRLDILVNAAVTHHNHPILDTTVEGWDQVQAINLRSAFLTTRAAVPLMRQAGGGRIINITTIGGRAPVLHGNGAYSASRAGLNMFTLNCALDFAADNITANAILPGAIITETMDTRVKRTGPGTDPARQLHGYGRPDDIAGLVLLLASPAGRYITGQQIAVDGGFLLS